MENEIQKKRRKRAFALSVGFFLSAVFAASAFMQFHEKYTEEKILSYILYRNPTKSISEAMQLQQAILHEADNLHCRFAGITCERAEKIALLVGVIDTESEFIRKARSRVGAQGYMQLMPATARLVAGHRVSLQEIRHPDFNLKTGIIFLNDMLREFGDLKLALLAYNAGPYAVKAGRGVPSYAQKVFENATRFKTYQPDDPQVLSVALTSVLAEKEDLSQDKL